MSTLTIGKLANSADVNIETIRYYQRRGLINEPIKPKSGYRQYPVETVDTLKFIKRSQQLGFSLAEIKELLDLGNGHCHDVKHLAEAKIDAIDHQIKDLALIRKELAQLIDACETTEGSHKCALIESLSQSKP